MQLTCPTGQQVNFISSIDIIDIYREDVVEKTKLTRRERLISRVHKTSYLFLQFTINSLILSKSCARD